MMKTLILTEKPSVAMDFAKSLNVSGRRDGYIEDDRYVITWAIGHLVELFEPEDYDPGLKKWRLEALPIIPDRFRYKPVNKTKKQLRIVKSLLKPRKINRLVIATDAGREGEVIARTIIQASGFPIGGNVFRFWTSQALTPSVVREAMKRLRPATDFDRLWHAGQSRQIADWLVGMNGSRAATIRMNGLFSVGRVQTAVLALLVDRRRERENFRPEPYWILYCRFQNEKGEWRGTWFKGKEQNFRNESDARKVLGRVKGKTGTVASVKTQKKKQPPPLLYSLTDLQREANTKFGFPAKKTLSVAQKLYENRKCLSYPRTDSRVLGSKNVSLARDLVDELSAAYPPVFSGVDRKLISNANKRVFNDAKLTDHHALIPLARLSGSVSPDEFKIYHLVLKRFAAAFHPDCEYRQTEIVTAVERETFKTAGKIVLKPGWTAVYKDENNREKEEPILPPLAKGDPAFVRNAGMEKKMTKPPPEYSEALLLKDMTNPGRYVDEDELKKIYRGDVGLGTQATRAQIIETLLARKYAYRAKKKLVATDKGCVLIDSLRQSKVASGLTHPEQTAEWERELDRIARGRGSHEQFVARIIDMVGAIVGELGALKISGAPSAGDTQNLGNCPACGGRIIEGKRGYGCSNWREVDGGCRFVVWKTISGKSISKTLAGNLIKKRKAGPFDGFVSDDGKPFSASLAIENTEGVWGVSLRRTKSPANGPGPCPLCGGPVIVGKKGYGCSNWRDADGGCRFVIWKTIAGKKITESMAKTLLKKGITRELKGFKSKAGKKFNARLKLENGKIRFDFR